MPKMAHIVPLKAETGKDVFWSVLKFMKNEWRVIFVERRSLFLHHFNDSEVILLESANKRDPPTF